MSDTKKHVCRTFARVLQESDLSERIDPTAFFHLLSSNFEQLYSTDRLDTTPLWEALATRAPSDRLFGLFLAFEWAGNAQGFQVSLPPPVRALTPEQRAEAVRLFNARAPAEPAPRLPSFTEEVPAEAPPALLSSEEPPKLLTADLRPVVADEQRKAIVQAAVRAMTSTPSGKGLDRSHLLYMVDSNFERLYDLDGFDFGALMRELRALGGVSDEELYAVEWRLERELAEYDIEIKTLDLDLSEEDRARISTELEARAKAEKRTVRARIDGPPPPPAPPAFPPPKLPPRRSSYERPASAVRKKLVPQWLRYAILGILLVGAGVTAYLLRPDRPIGVKHYPIPLVSARFFQGTFQGILDEPRWWHLPAEDREKMFAAFESRLRAEGRLSNAQVRGKEGQLLVTTGDGNRLRPAAFFLYGSPDGTVPEKALKNLKAPEDVRRMLRGKAE